MPLWTEDGGAVSSAQMKRKNVQMIEKAHQLKRQQFVGDLSTTVSLFRIGTSISSFG